MNGTGRGVTEVVVAIREIVETADVDDTAVVVPEEARPELGFVEESVTWRRRGEDGGLGLELRLIHAVVVRRWRRWGEVDRLPLGELPPPGTGEWYRCRRVDQEAQRQDCDEQQRERKTLHLEQEAKTTDSGEREKDKILIEKQQ